MGRQLTIALRRGKRLLSARNQPSRVGFSIFQIGRPLVHQEQTIYCLEYRAAIRQRSAEAV